MEKNMRNVVALLLVLCLMLLSGCSRFLNLQPFDFPTTKNELESENNEEGKEPSSIAEEKNIEDDPITEEVVEQETVETETVEIVLDPWERMQTYVDELNLSIDKVVPSHEFVTNTSTTWDLTDGVLTISGTGPMKDVVYADSIEWYDVRDSITAIVVEEGVTTLGKGAFIGIDTNDISLPSTLTYIGDYAFSSNESLLSMVIPEGVTKIGEYAFKYCHQMTEITLPPHLTEIPDNCFNGCMDLLSITIPEGVLRVGKGAFSSCYDLDEINLPSTLKVIGAGAFDGDAESIVIPDSVEVIGADAFFGMELTSLDLGHGVRFIQDTAFYGSEHLAEVTLPASLEFMDGNVFAGCRDLEQIVLEEGNEYLTMVDGVLFTKDMSTLLWYSPYRTDESYTVPDGVKTIAYAAFSFNKYITSVILPEGIEKLDHDALGGCDAVTQLNFPASLMEIGWAALDGVSLTGDIVLPEGLITLGSFALADCDMASVTVPSTVETIGFKAFENCENLTDAFFYCDHAEFGTDVFFDSETVTVHAHAGSSGEAYAIENGIPFEVIE